jgi:hypothetical protein
MAPAVRRPYDFLGTPTEDLGLKIGVVDDVPHQIAHVALQLMDLRPTNVA